MLARLDLRPTGPQLRQFGFIALLAFGALGGVVLWRGGLFGFDFASSASSAAYVLWALGALSGVLSLVWPAANRPLFILLSLLAFPIGWVLSHVALAILFFGILTPLALFFRLIGRDPLTLTWEPEQDSYWVDVQTSTEKRDYFRQF